MATKFLEPGGDATFNAVAGVNGGFWSSGIAQSGAIATDFVHGKHKKSIQYGANAVNVNITPDGVVADSGSRVSYYLYINALPNANCTTLSIAQSIGVNPQIKMRITSAGVLILVDSNNTQIGSNGPTLSTGIWYRICLAYTITSTTVNRFELFVNGISGISITNATIINTGSSAVQIGNSSGNAVYDIRCSDFYIDDSNSLKDTGDIWVTAKRPVANGTANQWTTQIGAGSSGYGSGHSPQVNERALSNTNGWSIQNAAKKTEEYSIEAKNVGDIDISKATIIDYMGWVDCKVGSNSTGNIIVGGSASNIAVTTTENLFTKIKGSSTYPTGNTDIGMDTNTVNQLFSLYECGIIVAYIPRGNFFLLF